MRTLWLPFASWLAGCLFLLPQVSHARDAADLVLRRGVFYTVTPRGAVSGSLAARGGRIVYLGADSGVEGWIGPATRVIDLQGRSVTPGLIDSHSHLEGLGKALEQVDLRGAETYDAVIQRVAHAAATVPPGSWIEGRGWDQNLWPDKEFPHQEALSARVPDHPVWLTRIDGHAALVNARAMRELGITAATSDPPGGRLLRDAAGKPTGVLVDQAKDLFAARLPAPTAADRLRRLRRAATRCLEVGLTTVTDMGVGPDTMAAYRSLAASGELPLRAAVFWDGLDPNLERYLAGGPWEDPTGHLVIHGVKLYADGALGSRGAALLEPYADDPRNLGLLVTPGPKMEGVARLALAHGFQVGIHAIGDRGAVVALDAMEAALGGPRPDARFRLEHTQVIRPQDILRMARLGIIAAMQPTHATSDMPWAERRLGHQRLSRAYAWRQVLNAGVRLAFGSDFPVEKPDPLLGLYAAVTRQDLTGNPPGGWMPAERLSREEALAAFTRDAAYAVFLEDQVGTLEVGKRADLVVFDRDPMTVPAREIPRAGIDWTIVGGEVAYERKGKP